MNNRRRLAMVGVAVLLSLLATACSDSSVEWGDVVAVPGRTS